MSSTRNVGNRAFLNVNYYGVLGVSPSATEAEITSAYRRLQLQHHTDRGGTNYMSLLLNEAKRILLDREFRVHYDHTRPLDDSATSNLTNRLFYTQKLSAEVLNDLEGWKKEFDSIQLKDNFLELLTPLIGDIESQDREVQAGTAFNCFICKKTFVSEDEHYLTVLEPYLIEMIGLSEETVFDYLRRKLVNSEVKLDTDSQGDLDPSTALLEILTLLDAHRNDEAIAMCLQLETHTKNGKESVKEALIVAVEAMFAEDAYSLGEAYKTILTTFPPSFSSSDSIHRFWLSKFKQGNSMESYNLTLAALHYLNAIAAEDIEDFQSWSSQLLAKLIRDSVAGTDFHTLSQILHATNGSNVRVLEGFLEEKRRLYDLSALQGDYKVAIACIEGTIAKVRGDVASALEHFDAAQQAAISSPAALEESIFKMIQSQFQDVQFHAEVLNQLREELSRFAKRLRNGLPLDFSEADFQLPTLLPDLKVSSLFDVHLSNNCRIGGQARIAQRNEEGIRNRMTNPLSKALAYFDLSQGLDSSTGKVSAFLMAISKILEVMEAETEDEDLDLGTLYAYRNLVRKYCCSAFVLSQRYDAPNAKMFTQRCILSAVIRSNAMLSAGLRSSSLGKKPDRSNYDSSPNPEDPEMKKTEEGITTSGDIALVLASLGEILILAKLYPFIRTPMQCVTDRLLRQRTELQLLSAFIQVKVNDLHHHDSQFPRHIYSHAQFDSIWRDWTIQASHSGTDSEQFEDAKLDAMYSLLEAQNWNIEEVEEIMQWRLVRRTEAGWMNNEEIDLDFDEIPKDQCYSACRGFEIDDKTGVVTLLLDQGTPTLFTLADVIDILDNNISSGCLTLEDPDPKLNSHPFQKFKYFPKALKGTDYLNDLLHTDLLLKQITTGMEINAQAPFELRKTSDGFLQRLPEEFQEKLKPVMERRRDPINPTSSDAHRFWIQLSSVVKWALSSGPRPLGAAHLGAIVWALGHLGVVLFGTINWAPSFGCRRVWEFTVEVGRSPYPARILPSQKGRLSLDEVWTDKD